MRKSIIATCFGVLVISLALTAQKTKSTPVVPPSAKSVPSATASVPNSKAAVDNSKAEPSGIYGYITVVDPSSGRHYVGDTNATASERGSGLQFDFHVIFRGTTDPTQTFDLRLTRGAAYYRNPPAAVWYSIPFMQDAAAGDSPMQNYRDGKVHYNPARWRFLRLDVPAIGWTQMTDAGVTTPVSVPMTAVPPIADFPDFAGALTGPSR